MIIVYSKDLSNFKEITHAVSVQMLEYYNDIGKITMVLPIDDYNISAIENDGIVYDTDRDMSFTIQAHKYDTTNNTITVNGYTCNWLLDKRVIAQKASIRTVERDVYAAVSGNLRGLPNVLVSQGSGFPETADSVFVGGQLLTKLMPTLQEAKIGNRMAWDPDNRKHVFTLYKGRDLTEGIHAVTFSSEQGTAKDLVILSDSSMLKTVIYVQGVLDNDTEIIEIVGQTGPDMCEFWLRETERQDADETEESLRQRMRQKGLEKIAERITRETFSVTIDSSEYGNIYKLGDIVSCASLKFGVELTSRITGVQYTLDRNGEKVSLILGEPVLTALGEVKMNNG